VHEHVGRRAGVPGRQVRGSGVEGDEATVRRQHGAVTAAIRLGAVRGHASAGDGPGLPVVDEHIVVVVVVPGHQVRGSRVEGHPATIRRQMGIVTVAVALDTSRGQAHPGGGSRLPVVHEHVAGCVVVPGHQVRGRGFEGHVATVRGEEGVGAVAIGLGATRGHAHAGGGPRLPVVHEDIARAVGVHPGPEQVRGSGEEGDVASVRRQGGIEAEAIALGAVRGHAYPRGGARLSIVREDVVGSVVVPGHQRR